MENTVSTIKIGFRVVYLHKLSGQAPFECEGQNTFDDYQTALDVASWVCNEMDCETRSVTIKYIIAQPVVGTEYIETLIG